MHFFSLHSLTSRRRERPLLAGKVITINGQQFLGFTVAFLKSYLVNRTEVMTIKEGGRPTRLLPHAKMLLIPIKLFLFAG